jgi:hypothetical protein
MTDTDNKINENRDPRRAPNEPPDRGGVVPAPADGRPDFVAPAPELPASKTGRWPTREAPNRSQRSRQ